MKVRPQLAEPQPDKGATTMYSLPKPSTPVQVRVPVSQPTLAALKSNPWFATFPASALGTLASVASIRSFGAGELIQAQGKSCGSVVLVVKGRVRAVRRTEDGRDMTLETYKAGALLAEAIFDATSVVPNDWVAGETSLLLFIPREVFLGQIRNVPEAALFLIRDLERRLGRVKSIACDLALNDVETRLHNALARLAREEGEETPEGWMIRKCPTQQEIGKEIGACRETVSRMIAELGRRALVAHKGRRLILTPKFFENPSVSQAA
jgi:CRP-like cAMP-binding protein